MKILVVAVCCLVSIIDGSSQEIKPAKNSLYFELLGSGGLYSINYERKVSSNLYGRVGMTTFNMTDFLGETDPRDRITAFPVMLTYLLGNGKSHHFEIAGGMLAGLKSETGVNYKIIDLVAFIGYRYQPPAKGMVFRIGLSPFFSLDNDADYPDKGFTPSAGISWGYHF